MDLSNLVTLADDLQWVKFSSMSWQGAQGFFYGRYDPPQSVLDQKYATSPPLSHLFSFVVVCLQERKWK